MNYDGHEWLLDPAPYGSKAVASWAEYGGGYAIALRRAVLPGTDLRADLVACLAPSFREWWIHVSIVSLGFKSSAPLGAWISGAAPLESAVRGRSIHAGGGAISLVGDRNRLRLRPPLAFEFLGAQGPETTIRYDGPVACGAAECTLAIQTATDDTLRASLLGIQSTYATSFALRRLAFAEPAWTCNLNDLTCAIDEPRDLTGELYSNRGRAEGVVLMEGAAVLQARHPAGTGRGFIRVENASAVTTSGRTIQETALAGRVLRAAHTVSGQSFDATLSGDDEFPFVAHVRGDETTTLHLKARLQEVWLPVPGVERATLSVPARTVRLQARAESTPSEAGAPRDHGSLIVLGTEPYLVSSLDGATLTLRRGADLFNLTFQFKGFDVEVKHGEAFLRRRASTEPARITVLFPPQHIAEQNFSVTDPWACMPNMPPFPDVSRARMSGWSRIVFDVPDGPEGKDWLCRPLTIENLTDWSMLQLLVDRRCQEPDVPFLEQLKIAGIATDTSLEDAVRNAAKQLQPPVDKTALELAGRLVFSPSGSAKWLTPRGPIDASAALLWHARLNEPGRKTVRAIWSYFMVPGQFNECRSAAEPGKPCTPAVDGPGSDPLLPFEVGDHWQIVGQTSAYGLIALRRITDDTVDPVDQALRDLPRSRVVRPDETYQSLTRMDLLRGYKEKDSGFAVPAPFRDADIVLTSIGGSFIGEWQGEPAFLLNDASLALKWPNSFSLERFAYWSHLGRDIRIEVVKKGYLLPLGIRASYVALTERRFFKHPRLNYPVAFPVTRRFIVIQKPQKRFPTVNQPYGSRDFPAHRVEMRTKVSPDLYHPAPSTTQQPHGKAIVHDGGLVTFPASGNGSYCPLIFWPRVKEGFPGTPGDVEFKWTLDDDQTPVTSNLLFVENTALALEDLMKDVAEYYRSIGKVADSDWVSLRTASLNGVRRRYAATDTEGSTSFDTHSWLLSARGRILPPDPNTHPNEEVEIFRMDGRMEGADQPSFYPFVDAARLNVQSLDRLLGRPVGLVKVAFDPAYVRHDFGTSENKSEIYLDVIEPDIPLDVSSQGRSTGGVAKPNTLVVALSRSVGLIGGKKVDAAALARARATRTSLARAIPQSQSPYDFKSATEGKFDPAEFFGGLGTAKVLGLVPLMDVLKEAAIAAAPKLIEKVGHGPAAATVDAALARIRDLVTTAAKPLHERLARLDDEIDAAFAPHNVKFQDLYPRLDEALDGVDVSLGHLIAVVAENKPFVDVIDAASAVVPSGKALLTEIERTLRDPVPQVVQNTLNGLASQWQVLKTLANSRYMTLGRDLQQTVVAVAIREFCKKVDAAGVGSLLFGLGGADTCESLAAHPENALEAVERSLFAQVFGRPLAEMLQHVRSLEAEVTARISWSRAAVRDAIRSAVSRAIALVSSRLDIHSTILKESVQAALTQAILTDVTNVIESAIAGAGTPTTFAEVDKTLLEIQSRVEASAVAAIRASIDKWVEDRRDEFIPLVPADLDAIIDSVKTGSLEPIVTGVRVEVNAKVASVRALVVSRLQEARGEAIARLLGGIQRIVGGMEQSLRFAQIAKVGRSLTTWCGTTAGPQTAAAIQLADEIASRALGDVRYIAANLKIVIDKADQLQPPSNLPPELRERFHRAVAGLKAAAQHLASTAQAIERSREVLGKTRREVDANTSPDACSNVLAFLQPTQDLFNLRRTAVGRIKEIADHVLSVQEILDTLVAPAPIAPAAAALPFDPALQAITTAAAGLLTQLTSIESAATNGQWQQVQSRIEQLRNWVAGQAPGLATYVQDLDRELDALQDLATKYQTALATADPRSLAPLAEYVLQYAVANDKKLAALVLQSVALVDTLRIELEEKAQAILSGAAQLFVALHTVAEAALKALVGFLSQPPITVFINPKLIENLTFGTQEVSADRGHLEDIVAAASPEATLEKAQKLRDRWSDPHKPPALVRVLSILADLIEAVLRGELGALVDDKVIRTALLEAAESLKTMVSQLLPTRADLNYGWTTSLGPFPKDGPIFEMQASAADDLTLRSDVSIDFISGARSAVVQGTLKPFKVNLLGDLFKIATISFSGASFRSENGSAPQFKAAVDGVTTRDLIKFLEPLQKWLSPSSDSGFFVRPILKPAGIEAGYVYDAGMIQLGTLNFMNVALGVAARLPFEDNPAEFEFHLASVERPFLISSPPYGGGGHIQLIATARHITSFSLSFSFGAVVALKFGPFSGHGRVTAGFWIKKTGEEQTIAALFEAVGEGNLGCFSLCVSLKIKLTHHSSGVVDGEATYQMTFKLGFLDFHFEFTARHEQGSKRAMAERDRSLKLDKASTLALRAVQSQSKPKRYRNLTPRKSSDWRAYKRRVALELLPRENRAPHALPRKDAR